MKINPILNKRLFGVKINEYLGISVGAILGNVAGDILHVDSTFLRFVVFCLAWLLGVFIYTVVIALIKTYITKEK